MWLLLGKKQLTIFILSFLLSGTLLTILGQGDFDSTSDNLNETSVEKKHGFVGFRIGVYHNDDDQAGNVFLDEKLTVIEPVLIFDINVSDKTAFWGKFSYDYVSSASIDRLNKFPDQSGASGDYYYGLDLGARRKLSDRFRIGGFASGSSEYDYDSFGLGGDLSWDAPSKNTTVKLSANGFWDRVQIIRFNGNEDEGKDDRNSFSSTLHWYQVINPKSHSEVGVTYSRQTGLLETAFNGVFVEFPGGIPKPQEVSERLPDRRIRSALFGRIRRYINPHAAIELYSRFYSDDWGIDSFAMEPQLHYWLIEEILRLRLRYRFYTQTKADDFKKHFFPSDFSNRLFFTQDSDLGNFDSHTIGFKFDWHITSNLKLDISSNYIFRSDDLDQIVGSIGFKRGF